MTRKSPQVAGQRYGLEDVVVEIDDPELQVLIKDPQVAAFLSAYLSIADPSLRRTLRRLVEEVLSQTQQPPAGEVSSGSRAPN